MSSTTPETFEQLQSMITDNIGLTLQMKNHCKTIEDALRLLMNIQANKDGNFSSTIINLQAMRDSIINQARVEATAIKDKAEELLARMNERSQELCEEKSHWDAEQARIAQTQLMAPCITVNVGGINFTTTLRTLCRYPESLIAQMFSGRHNMHRRPDGAFFIDRDGRNFHHILNFLRNPDGWSSDMLDIRENTETRIEAAFYGLEDLMFRFKPASPQLVLDHDGYEVMVTQSNRGLWGIYTGNNSDMPTTLIVCSNCPAGYWRSRSQPDRYYYIDDFQTAHIGFNSDVRVLQDRQPRCSTYHPCPRCGSTGIAATAQMQDATVSSEAQ